MPRLLSLSITFTLLICFNPSSEPLAHSYTSVITALYVLGSHLSPPSTPLPRCSFVSVHPGAPLHMSHPSSFVSFQYHLWGLFLTIPLRCYLIFLHHHFVSVHPGASLYKAMFYLLFRLNITSDPFCQVHNAIMFHYHIASKHPYDLSSFVFSVSFIPSSLSSPLCCYLSLFHHYLLLIHFFLFMCLMIHLLFFFSIS